MSYCSAARERGRDARTRAASIAVDVARILIRSGAVVRLSCVIAAGSCTSVPGESSHGAPGRLSPVATDSIVLERGPCFGTCPVYRLRMDSKGYVHFQSRNPGEELFFAADTVPAERFDTLLMQARRVGFFELPASIDRSNAGMCPREFTDAEMITLTIVTDAVIKRVQHYMGCQGDARLNERLLQLKRYYGIVDSLAGARRWIRPARFLSGMP